jgi:hypothetical protein
MHVNAPPPAHCAVWGVFAQPLVYSDELPFPQQWEVLYSLMMAREYIGTVYCDQGGS